MNLITPKQIIIETTSRCNLKCKGCYRELDKTRYPDKDMDLALFKSIIDQVAKWKPVIVPFSIGEPLLNPLFGVMLGIIYKHGLHYNFSTNGTIWRDSIFDFALKTADVICFSLDALWPETALYFRGAPSPYINILKAINYEKRTSRIAVSLTKMGQDWGEIEDFIFSWLTNPKVDYVIIRNYLDSIPLKNSPKSHYRCKFHQDYYIVIRSDGKVPLCERNINAPIIGDLTKESIQDILPRLVEHDICKTCSQRFCGSGMFGEIRFKSNPTGPPIYFKQDYFNQIYSLKDIKKGISWKEYNI